MDDLTNCANRRVKKINTLSQKEKIFSAMIALFPLLGVYKSFVPGVDLGTFLLVGFSCIYILGQTIRINELFTLLVYILAQTPVMVFAISHPTISSTTIILRYGKFILSLGLLSLLDLRKHYNENYTFCIVRCVCYISGIMIVLQRLLLLVGIQFINPFLIFAMSDAYKGANAVIMLARPSGLFLEPSHYAVYAIPFLVYSLFKEENIKSSLYITFFILCTSSGMGLVASFGIIGFYLLSRFRKHPSRIIAISTLFGVAAVIFSTTSYFRRIVERFMVKNYAGGNAIAVRVGTGYRLFWEKGFLLKLFGAGYGNVPGDIYLNGIEYILNTIGIVGLLLFLRLLLKYYFREEPWKKVGILVFICLTTVHHTFNPADLVFSFSVYGSLHNDSFTPKKVIKKRIHTIECSGKMSD